MDAKPDAPPSLWDQILSEYKHSSQQARIQEANVVILGTQDGGSRSLIARILGKDHADKYKGYALEYEFTDVRVDADEDATGRLCLWHLEHPGYGDLLKVCLPPANILTSIVLLVVDLAVPHTIIDTLDEWIRRLSHYVDTSVYPANPELRRQADARVLKYLAKVQKEQADKQHTGDPHVGSDTGLSFAKEELEASDAVLGPGVMVTHLGIPLIVVGAKSDQLEKLTQGDAKPGAGAAGFDAGMPSRAQRQLRNFIQGHLRKWALAHGASLIYTSAHTNVNCNLLVEYINHRAFNFPFDKKDKSVTKSDALFVPFGTDSMAEITKLPVDQLCSSGLDTHYNAVIKAPEAKLAEPASQPVTTMDHQAFLKKLEQLQRHKGRDDPFLSKASPTTGKKEFTAPTRMKGDTGQSIEKDAAKFFQSMLTSYTKKP